MMPTQWTADRDARLVELRNAKTPFKQIADQIGCTVKVAEKRSRILRHGGVGVWVGNSMSKKTPDLVERLRSMLADGKSMTEAGAVIGISRMAVRKWMIAADRTTPPPPPTGGTPLTRANRHTAWNVENDPRLIEMRNAQSSWQQIADAFKVAQSTVYARAIALRDQGNAMWNAPESIRAIRQDGSTRTDLSPLPAGHSISWGAITAGTSLDGMEYPGAFMLRSDETLRVHHG